MGNQISIHPCFYFDRKKQELLRISKEVVKRQKIERKLKIYADSAIGLTLDGKIIIAGGTNSRGSISNRVYLINPQDSIITEIDETPLRIREGYIFEYEDYYYCFGATCQINYDDKESNIEGSEVLRYNKKDLRWELFYHNNESSIGKTYLKDILAPGVF